MEQQLQLKLKFKIGNFFPDFLFYVRFLLFSVNNLSRRLFMKKKILFGFVVVLIVCVGVYVLPYWVDYEVSKRLNLIEVVVARKDLSPRTVIDESHLDTIWIP